MMAKQRTCKKTTHRPPPIVVVPDKSYIDDIGNVIPMDVILISDLKMYERMSKVLKAWGKEPLGIPGQRGRIIG